MSHPLHFPVMYPHCLSNVVGRICSRLKYSIGRGSPLELSGGPMQWSSLMLGVCRGVYQRVALMFLCDVVIKW